MNDEKAKLVGQLFHSFCVSFWIKSNVLLVTVVKYLY